MNIAPDGTHLFVSDMFENVVRVLAASSGRHVTADVPAGMWPHDNVVSPDGRYVLNQSIGRIIKDVGLLRRALLGDDAAVPAPVRFDLLPGITADTVTAPAGASEEERFDAVHLITVFDAAPPFAVREVIRFDLGGGDVPNAFARGVRPSALSPDGRFLYAQLSDLRGVIEYDLEARRLTRSLDLAPEGEPAMIPPDDTRYLETYDFFRSPHHGLALSGDARTLCVAARADDRAYLVDRDAMALLAAVDIGQEPGWAATGPRGTHCYLANAGDGTVSVVSYAEQREIARIPVGAGVKHVLAGRVPEPAVCPQGFDPSRARPCGRGVP